MAFNNEQIQKLILAVGGEENALALIKGEAEAEVVWLIPQRTMVAVPRGVTTEDLLREIEGRGVRIDSKITEGVTRNELIVTESDRKPEQVFAFLIGERIDAKKPEIEFDFCGIKPATFGQTLQYIVKRPPLGEVVTTILPGSEPKALMCWPKEGREWRLDLFDLDEALTDGPIEMDEEYLVVMVDEEAHQRALAD